MYCSRREYLLILLSLGFQMASAKTLVNSKTTSQRKLSILQGATDYKSTQVAILLPKVLKLKYQLKEIGSDRVIPAKSLQRRERSTSRWVVDHVNFDNLKPATQYVLLVEDFIGNLYDQRTLNTLPTELSTAKIALASCMSDAPVFERIKIWETLINQKPDLIFFLGDNVYASIDEMVDPEILWDRYVQTRLSLEIFKKEQLIPIFATWDDHDFGQNDGDKSYPYVQESQQVFRDFFPQDSINTVIEKGPGISQAVNLLDHRFLFLDCRSFRDIQGGESMWGIEQEYWITSQVQTANKPLWIINGSQFFGKYGPSESLEKDYPENFKRFIELIKTSNQTVTFVSGDIHASEVMQIPKDMVGGLDILELTSSSMHSAHTPLGSLLENPRRINGFDGDSFLMVQLSCSEAADTKTKIEIQGFSKDSGLVFKIHGLE